MSETLSKEAIYRYVSSWSDFDTKEVAEEGKAYTVTLTCGEKSVVISTPFEVGEFFIDFQMVGQPFYSDWYEIMDGSLQDFMAYTRNVAERYLKNEVRIKTKGWWVFQTHHLEYLRDGRWASVFE
jgi:hypothetical protein